MTPVAEGSFYGTNQPVMYPEDRMALARRKSGM